MTNKKIWLPLLMTPLPLVISNAGNKESKTAQPNVIIILTDDMGYSDIGRYGGKLVATPNIDRMASEGIRFTQYYSASPISSPARAGLLTGMYPGQWNITSYLQSREGNRNAEMADYLDPNAPTISRAMKASGYRTAHFGKWHLGGGRDVDNAPPFEVYGYDEYSSTYESPSPDSLLTAKDWIWSSEDSIKRWNRTAYFVDKAIDFIKKNRGTPCFINLWPDDVHTPWVGSIEEQEFFPNGSASKKNFTTVMREYDKQIGRLLTELKALKLDNNTIVIFTSDNGPSPDFQRERTGNMRGCKASLFEGGIRMPFIVWDTDDLVPQDRLDEETVMSALDIFKSVCALTNTPLPKGYQGEGVDMSNALLGKSQKRSTPMFWEYGRNKTKSFPKAKGKNASPNVAVRKDNWKLLINADGSDVMLYDLKSDVREEINVCEDFPSVTNNLKAMALQWRNSLPKLSE